MSVITISAMRADRTVCVYEVHSEIEYASVVKFLMDMKYMMCPRDGMWVPICDVKQYEAGKRPVRVPVESQANAKPNAASCM